MKTLTSTALKNRFGSELRFDDNESLLIQKYGKDAYLVFTSETGKRLVLSAFATGYLSRADTMNLLGLDWYGSLLDELRQRNIPLPKLSRKIRKAMVKHASKLIHSKRG